MSDEKPITKWCAVHDCPTQVYSDGSFGCWHALAVETGTADCVVTQPPWEAVLTVIADEARSSLRHGGDLLMAIDHIHDVATHALHPSAPEGAQE